MTRIERKVRTEHETIMLMKKYLTEGKIPANLPQPFTVLKDHLDGFCTYLESFGYPHYESLRQKSFLHLFDKWLAENNITEFIPAKSEEYLSQISKTKLVSYRRALFFYKCFLENIPLEQRKIKPRKEPNEDSLIYPRRAPLKLDKRKYEKWVADHPSFFERKPYQVIESESNILSKYLSRNKYSKSSIASKRHLLRELDDYLVEHKIKAYSPDIYSKIETEFLKTVSDISKTKNVMRLLNSSLLHKPLIVTKQKKQPEPISKSLEILLTKYGQYCLNLGNKPLTVSKKVKLAREFLRNCSISDITELTPDVISHAVSITKNKDEWNYARLFFGYSFEKGIIDRKYCELVPKYSHSKKLPSTYTIEEITSIEFSVNRDSTIGKRDYALLLLATRMGFRSGDIVGMKFEYLDFENNKIKLFQQKTGNYIALEMIEIVKEALKDYIENARPKNKNPHVFLSFKCPYNQITTGALRTGVVKKYMSVAKISTTGKKHGPHALRASIATSMVNDDIPFEAVSKILGHSSKETIQRYAKLDIEHLRKCAIQVSPATGSFKFWLEGGFNGK